MHSALTPNIHQLNRWFYCFILFHLLLWSIVPTLVRYHLPMDSIEGALWGHQLEWGYDKNPFINAWVTAFAMRISHYQDACIYLMSQVAVVTCFVATWQLAKRMVSPAIAFLSVLLLEGIQFYHVHSIDLSDNLLELAGWSLTIYTFYCAMRGSKVAWLLTGIFAGLAMVTKYYSGFLLLSLAIFLLTEKTARQQLKTVPPYLGLILFMIVILPHVLWLISHDYITIHYMLARTDSISHWGNHIVFPAKFIYEQGLIVLPMLLLYGLLFCGRSSSINAYAGQPFDKRFVFFAGFLPFIFTLLLSAIFSLKLHAGWGTPLMTLWPLALFMLFKTPPLSMQKLRTITAVIIVLMSLLAGAYAYSLIYSTTPTSANFNGKMLAQELTDEWHKRYQAPLYYVAGSRFLAGSLAYYSSDHPSVWIDWNSQLSPWISEAAIKQHGAIFIFYSSTVMPARIKEQFLSMSKPVMMKIAWLRNSHHLPPEEITIVYVPPLQ